MSAPKPPPIVLVVWEDAQNLDAGHNWHVNVEEPFVYEPLIVHSVGFVLYDGDEGVVITESWNGGFTGPRTQIPRGMVRSIETLRTCRSAKSQTRN